MLSPRNQLAQDYIGSTLDALSQYGITISIETDFEEFHHLCSTLEGKGDPIDIFDPKAGDFDAFWIRGTDEFRRVVHTQAYRNHQFKGSTLGHHIWENRRGYMSRGYGIDPDQSVFHTSGAAGLQANSMTYHGEVWLDKSKRGNSLALLLVRLGLALSYQRWMPDYIFAFMYTRLIYKGIGQQYGYPHSATGGAEWWQPQKQQYLNEWLVWASRNELETMFKYAIEEEHSYLEPTVPLQIRAA